MKTPREILFEHHRHATPRLDALRREVLAAHTVPANANALPPTRLVLIQQVFSKVWLELIWPSRRAWAGLVALWLGILAANLQLKATLPSAPTARAAPAADVVQAFAEQRRVLAELLPPLKPPTTQTPRSAADRRSQRPVAFKCC
jgi:hypothetical protein